MVSRNIDTFWYPWSSESDGKSKELQTKLEPQRYEKR